MAAGSAPIDETRSLPSEASVVELRNGSVLMNTRNSCHRLPAPHTCCWGDGCYDKEGVPHCHGPKVCDHAHDNRHTRLLMFSDTGGMSWSDPEWCQPLPDPDCEGSMVSDVDTGALLFANSKIVMLPRFVLSVDLANPGKYHHCRQERHDRQPG